MEEKMKTKKIIVILVVLAMMLNIAACTQPQQATTAAPTTAAPTTAAPTEAPKEPIVIGGLTSLSGGLMDYGNQMKRGFELGLEYATNGTMMVAGRPIEVIWEDTTTVPEVARERAIKLLDEDEVDMIVGPTSSSDAFAILGLAEEYETVFILEPAAADFLTGEVANRYIFRTGRNTAQDAAAMAAVMAGSKVSIFAPDSAFGRAYTDPFKPALEAAGGEVLVEEYAPLDSTNFAPYIQRIINSNPDYVFVIWAGANDPWRQMTEMGLFEATKVSTGAPEIAALRNMMQLEGMPGFTLYYHGVAKNPVNDWLVKEHMERFGTPPDVFVSGGMAAAMAAVKAFETTNGSTDAEDLIKAMRGMEFDSPTGIRYFRSEDHQAQQVLFEITYTKVDGVDHIVPELVRVIPIEEIYNPIQTTHPR
jgi:branched-chain amino acid transport system substrate-binding protein